LPRHRAIPPNLEAEVLAKAGEGLSCPRLAAWLKETHGLKVSARAVQRFLRDIAEERKPIAQAVIRDKLGKTLTADLDAVEGLLSRAEANELEVGKLDDIIEELERLAKIDVGQAFDKSGKLKDLKKMPQDVRRAIASVQIEHPLTRPGYELTKVRFWDKARGLELLARLRSNLAERTAAIAAMEQQRKLYELRFKLSGAGGGDAPEGVVILPPEGD